MISYWRLGTWNEQRVWAEQIVWAKQIVWAEQTVWAEQNSMSWVTQWKPSDRKLVEAEEYQELSDRGT